MMQPRLKQRLVGAVVLVSAAVVFVPMLLDEPRELHVPIDPIPIPERPSGDRSVSSAAALGEPETPLLDAAIDREHNRYTADAEAEGESPAPTLPPRSESAAAPPATLPGASGGWAIQLGSFSNAKNATTLRDRIRAKGYTAFIESGSTAQGEVVRVFVGPMLDREQAEASMVRLQRETQLKGIVVSYPGG